MYVLDMGAPKEQGRGRRWSWVPWMREMERNCGEEMRLKIRLRGWNSAMLEEKDEGKEKGKLGGEGED